MSSATIYSKICSICTPKLPPAGTSPDAKVIPAVHYTMGGLWVDYNLKAHHSRLVCGRSEFLRPRSGNRLGAALIQNLADGYFVIPPSVITWAAQNFDPVDANAPGGATENGDEQARDKTLYCIKSNKTPLAFHKERKNYIGMTAKLWRGTKAGLESALKIFRNLVKNTE